MAHYSSLFTLGLLSDRASPPSSPKSNVFYKFRKSSLPTRALSKPSEIYAASPTESVRLSSPQFTNPFAASSPVSEASTELRSFLSLDLAADKSLNSSKLWSPLDSAISPIGPPHPTNLPPHQLRPSSSWHRSTPLSLPTRRPSRDSLRTLPSPRPAPSSALPDVPSERKEPRALPPIVIPNSSHFPPASSSSTRPTAGHGSPTSHRLPLSAPPVPVRSPSSPSNLVSPLSSPSFRTTRQDSFMSLSSAGTVTSARTTRRRNAERSNALACLEGRSRAPGRVPRSVRQRNFMSMSDDEDEEEARDADVEDDSDAPEQPRTSSRSTFVQSPPLPSPDRRPDIVTRRDRFPVDEEEDRVLPPSASSYHPHVYQQRTSSSSSASKHVSRSRRGTLESWFPLANFIDLKDDELQGWRGVVEIVNGL